MIQSIENIALTGVNAQNISVDVTDGSVMAYRVSIDTSSQITGNKTIAFTGVASESLTVINFIIEGGINTSGASKLIIGGVTIPDLFALNKIIVFFEYVNSAWVVHYSISAEQPGIIDGDSILDGSIPAVKLENDIAGTGMERDGSGGVKPKLEAVQPSMQIVAGELGTKLDPSRAVTKNSNGLGVNLESVNPSMQVDANQLGVKIAATGALEKTANGMEVKLDGDGLTKGANGLKTTNKRTIYVIASFDNDAMGGLTCQVRIPDQSKITSVRGSVWKEIAASDDGEIQLRASAAFGVPGTVLNTPYVIPAGEPVGTVVISDISEYVPTGYTRDGSWFLGFETTKPTPGGAVYLSIDIEVA